MSETINLSILIELARVAMIINSIILHKFLKYFFASSSQCQRISSHRRADEDPPSSSYRPLAKA